MARHRLLLSIVVLPALLSCDDPPAQTGSDPPAGRQEAVASWLAMDDPQSPARWLAARHPCAGVMDSDARVAALTRQLDAATQLYQESRRMIANRLAQAAGFLEQSGEPRCLETIMEDLTLRSAEAQGVSFGAVLQAYIVLRQDGIGHEAAIAQLRSQYDRHP